MRLYLSSFRLGDYPERIVDHCGDRKIAIIENALDFIPDDDRRHYEANIYSPLAEFTGMGLNLRIWTFESTLADPKSSSAN